MSKEQLAVQRARRAFRTGRSKPLEYRIQQLKNLLRLFEERKKEIANALKKDLNKNEHGIPLYETLGLEGEIQLAVKKLKEWAAPRPVTKNLLTISDEVYIQPEPLGVVLIIGAWNYPWAVTIQPLIGAIAAAAVRTNTHTTVVVNNPGPPQAPHNPPAAQQYPGYQPVPMPPWSGAPAGYGGHPVPSAPMLEQPYGLGPPPPYQENAVTGGPPSYC